MALLQLHNLLLAALIPYYALSYFNPKFNVKFIACNNMLSERIPQVPYFPRKHSKEYQWMDIYNALGRKRTIFVARYLDDETSNQLIASLIWLQSQSSTDPVNMYFSVPGADLKPSFAVYDIMQRMTCPLVTINSGLTAGMGSLLCAAGTAGKRFALPNSRFIISQSGVDCIIKGQKVDINVHVADMLTGKEKFINELARLCKQSVAKLKADLKRNFFLNASEAVSYGLIDQVLLPT